ncbi:zinc finger matrin-type protein 4 isoform X2 [Brachyhypopomus gauderio]|uniref:zinc finger matrin-type protein 4 isoform X2 n=1 Tax=Brachyhypopomus gauderio TaxID=698409 RepID=UPI00404292A7
MKSTETDPSLFTAAYCRVCSAQLISESQRVAHYKSRKHANRVRHYYMLHPADGGCPVKKLRADNDGDVDQNKCCVLCNMFFTSAVVAQSHYQGKIHAKRLKLLLGESPANAAKETSGGLEQVVSAAAPGQPGNPGQPGSPGQLCHRYCPVCRACFNHPGMALQHYSGKKHRRNTAHAHLLAQLGESLGPRHTQELQRRAMFPVLHRWLVWLSVGVAVCGCGCLWVSGDTKEKEESFQTYVCNQSHYTDLTTSY